MAEYGFDWQVISLLLEAGARPSNCLLGGRENALKGDFFAPIRQSVWARLAEIGSDEVRTEAGGRSLAPSGSSLQAPCRPAIAFVTKGLEVLLRSSANGECIGSLCTAHQECQQRI